MTQTITNDIIVQQYVPRLRDQILKYHVHNFVNSQMSDPVEFNSESENWVHERDNKLILHNVPKSSIGAAGQQIDGNGNYTSSAAALTTYGFMIHIENKSSLKRVEVINKSSKEIVVGMYGATITCDEIVTDTHILKIKNLIPNEKMILYQSDISTLLSIAVIEYEANLTSNYGNVVNKVMQTDYKATILPGIVEVYFDQDDSLNAFALALLGGAALGTNFINLQDLIAFLGPNIQSLLSPIAQLIGEPVEDVVIGYASAWAASLSQGWYSLTDLLEPRFHIGIIQESLTNPQMLLSLGASFTSQFIGNETFSKLMSTGATFGLALGVFSMLAVKNIHYHPGDTDFSDFAQPDYKRVLHNDLAYTYSVETFLGCLDGATTPVFTTISMGSATLNSNDDTYKQDFRLRELLRPIESLTNFSQGDLTLYVSQSGHITIGSTAGQNNPSPCFIYHRITIDDVNTLRTLQNFQIRNFYKEPIYVLCSDEAETINNTYFFSGSGVPAIPANLIRVKPAETLTLPSEVFAWVHYIYVFVYEPTYIPNYLTYEDPTSWITPIDDGFVDLIFDSASGFSAMATGLLAGSAVLIGALPIDKISNFLLQQFPTEFKEVASALSLPVTRLVAGYASAWAIAVSSGWITLNDLLKSELHKEILNEIIKNPIAISSLLATGASALMSNVVGTGLGIAGQAGFSIAIIGVLQTMRRWAYL